ncbi:uncharacterized protein LOC115379191 [Myripristis murdjan]|uniref:uncharacterized protein LOC115379191 n=1 Tax=Myripristis murdjan TaxID=586833 RepID=UPI0011760EBC|nr:uncharacterized protein LOC115379191 [Myripristis murdjan]
MPAGLLLAVLLQGLALLPSDASPLGLVVHVLPLDASGGNTVRAHFTAIAPNPCPELSGLCGPGKDCVPHLASAPLSGTKPGPGWCVRQWQKTVPSSYNATINVGSEVFFVALRAGPSVRANSGRLNTPPYVGLPPPLRARVNCPHHLHLSVKDLDGDEVRCRFARADRGECPGCSQHAFLELDEETCMLSFSGDAPAGQYSVALMVEDIFPVLRMSYIRDLTPLSSIPVLLSLTVEEASSSCSAEPVAAGQTPDDDARLYVLPFQQVDVPVSFVSELESVLEIAVVGPPALFISDLRSSGSLTNMTLSWVRGQNNLAPLLPVCFAANTDSLQSESRCVWLYQREMATMPAGTELTCEQTDMTVLLPVATLTNIDLAELQLNSPTCPVSYNNTHLSAHIPFSGCGTKTVHSGSELIYTNVLQSVRPYTVITRLPALVVPLACRFPAVHVKGPQYQIVIPTEREVFGNVTFWLELHNPGEGPFRDFTRVPRFRHLHGGLSGRQRRAAPPSADFHGSVRSKVQVLDLHVMSNCRLGRAELMVDGCVESEMEDFAVIHPVLEQGCVAATSTLELLLSSNTTKIYRLDLNTMAIKGSTMFMECTVYLCVPTMPSRACPDPCARSRGQSMVIDNVFTRMYKVRSGPIDLVADPSPPNPGAGITTTTAAPAPATATATGTGTTSAAAAKPSAAAQNTTTTAHAPHVASGSATGLILTLITVSLQSVLLC